MEKSLYCTGHWQAAAAERKKLSNDVRALCGLRLIHTEYQEGQLCAWISQEDAVAKNHFSIYVL
jgi:hypothetical protein